MKCLFYIHKFLAYLTGNRMRFTQEISLVAQLVERQSNKLSVLGSIPSEGITFFFAVRNCNVILIRLNSVWEAWVDC